MYVPLNRSGQKTSIEFQTKRKMVTKAEDFRPPQVIEFVINRPSHVNIADILVLPQAQATSSIIDKK